MDEVNVVGIEVGIPIPERPVTVSYTHLTLPTKA